MSSPKPISGQASYLRRAQGGSELRAGGCRGRGAAWAAPAVVRAPEQRWRSLEDVDGPAQLVRLREVAVDDEGAPPLRGGGGEGSGSVSRRGSRAAAAPTASRAGGPGPARRPPPPGPRDLNLGPRGEAGRPGARAARCSLGCRPGCHRAPSAPPWSPSGPSHRPPPSTAPAGGREGVAAGAATAGRAGQARQGPRRRSPEPLATHLDAPAEQRVVHSSSLCGRAGRRGDWALSALAGRVYRERGARNSGGEALVGRAGPLMRPSARTAGAPALSPKHPQSTSLHLHAAIWRGVGSPAARSPPSPKRCGHTAQRGPPGPLAAHLGAGTRGTTCHSRFRPWAASWGHPSEAAHRRRPSSTVAVRTPALPSPLQLRSCPLQARRGGRRAMKCTENSPKGNPMARGTGGRACYILTPAHHSCMSSPAAAAAASSASMSMPPSWPCPSPACCACPPASPPAPAGARPVRAVPVNPRSASRSRRPPARREGGGGVAGEHCGCSPCAPACVLAQALRQRRRRPARPDPPPLRPPRLTLAIWEEGAVVCAVVLPAVHLRPGVCRGSGAGLSVVHLAACCSKAAALGPHSRAAAGAQPSSSAAQRRHGLSPVQARPPVRTTLISSPGNTSHSASVAPSSCTSGAPLHSTRASGGGGRHGSPHAGASLFRTPLRGTRSTHSMRSAPDEQLRVARVHPQLLENQVAEDLRRQERQKGRQGWMRGCGRLAAAAGVARGRGRAQAKGRQACKGGHNRGAGCMQLGGRRAKTCPPAACGSSQRLRAPGPCAPACSCALHQWGGQHGDMYPPMRIAWHSAGPLLSSCGGPPTAAPV